jgi:hypothetical protein
MAKKLTVSQIEEEIYGKGGLAERVRADIKRRGMTPTVVKTGLSHSSAATMLKYDRPKFDTLKKWCELLGVE